MAVALFVMAHPIACVAASSVSVAEGPLESLNCLAKANYWEGRNQPFIAQVQIAAYLIDISKAGRPGISTPCDAVRKLSQGYEQHVHESPAGLAWYTAQAAAIMAWTNNSLDHSHGQGAYFIDIQRLSRPGFKTEFVEQLGPLLFFKEVPTGDENGRR